MSAKSSIALKGNLYAEQNKRVHTKNKRFTRIMLLTLEKIQIGHYNYPSKFGHPTVKFCQSST
jgi:hypothetical protein